MMVSNWIPPTLSPQPWHLKFSMHRNTPPGAPSSFATNPIRRARLQRGFSLRELARRAGTSHATLSAYEHGTKSPTVATLLRIIHACDLAMDVQLRPRVREHNGVARGDELAQALYLAQQFPSRPARRLNAPVFATMMNSDDRSG